MKEVDLSGIDPLRRDEVRRRIGILKRYLALKSPTKADAERHAKELGTGVQQFYRLVKAWRTSSEPKAVGAGTSGGHRSRSDGVSESARRIVNDTIKELGADTPVETLLRKIRRRCAEAGTPSPSRGALWTYVMDARSTSPIRTSDPKRLVVGRVWAKLPTEHDGEAFFPEISLVLYLPSRDILGIDVSTDPTKRASAVTALARARVASPEAFRVSEIVIEVSDLAKFADDLPRPFDLALKPTSASTSRIISQNLGRVVGGLRILYRAHKAKPDRLVSARSAHPVSSSTAVSEIEQAIRRHNEREHIDV